MNRFSEPDASGREPVRSQDHRERGSPWIHLLLIAGVASVLYAQVVQAPFVFDDLSNITLNRLIRLESFDLNGLLRAAFESRSPRPVANLSFALNHLACGYEVGCYRAINILVHVANGLLVYSLATVLFLRLAPGDGRAAQRKALLAALVFVAHPIQTQAVTYVVQRMTSMATLFYLLALLAYVRGRGNDGRRRWGWWAGAAFSGLLAFGSKQIAVSLPLAIALVEWQFFQAASLTWLRRRAGPVLVLLGVCALLGIGYLAWLDFPGYELREFTLGQRLLTQLRVVSFYVGLLLLPLPGRLNLIHDFTPSTSLFDPASTAAGAGFLLLLLVAGLALASRRRLLSFAILWFFLQLALESSFFPLELAYEHRLYLPMFGFALLVAGGVFRLAAGRRALVLALGGSIVLALAAGTIVRNRVWIDPVTLWEDVVAKSPFEARAHSNLVTALRHAERFPDAVRHYEEVLARSPGYAPAHHGLGVLLERAGDLEGARLHHAEATRLAPERPLYRLKLGLILYRLGDREAGIRELTEVAKTSPKRGHQGLGYLMEREERFEQAERHYQQVLRIAPDDGTTHLRLANLMARDGHAERAAYHLQQALRADPYNAELGATLRKLEARLSTESGGSPQKAPNTMSDKIDYVK